MDTGDYRCWRARWDSDWDSQAWGWSRRSRSGPLLRVSPLARTPQAHRPPLGVALVGVRTATVSRATVTGMAAREDKVTVQVDAEMVERARAELGLGGGSDAAVVERALNAYLLGRLLDVTQARAGLSEDEASSLAYEELRASRRERGAA